MNSILFYASAIFLMLKASCTKEHQPKETTLNGTWTWIKTEGGMAHHLHQTPATTGEVRALKITNSNQYFMYTNGVVTSEGTFTTDNKNCIHDHKQKTWLQFATGKNYMVEVLEDGKLILSDEAFDGLEIHYERKNIKDN